MPKLTAKQYFLQNAIMLYDSREQKNQGVLQAFKDVGIKYERRAGTGLAFNYGDYTLLIDGKDYRGELIFERKGSLNEIYTNVNDKNKTKNHSNSDFRNNLEREFQRMNVHKVREKWLLIEGADTLEEIKEFKLYITKEKPIEPIEPTKENSYISSITYDERLKEFRNQFKKYNYFTNMAKIAGKTIYATLMSWQCSNRHNFKIYCSKSQYNIGVEMVSIAYYYWRNEMKNKGLIKGNYYIGE